MKTQLIWRKSFFGSRIDLFSGQSKIGEMKEETWSQTAVGVLNDKRFEINNKGFFKKGTKIIAIVGRITYNGWRAKATIEFEGKIFNWSYDNAWHSRWTVFDAGQAKIRYKGNTNKGKIEIQTMNEALILAGLYVYNYYWKMAIGVMAAIGVPIVIGF